MGRGWISWIASPGCGGGEDNATVFCGCVVGGGEDHTTVFCGHVVGGGENHTTVFCWCVAVVEKTMPPYSVGVL